MKHIVLLSFLILLNIFTVKPTDTILCEVVKLQCEHLPMPIGIDTYTPRLSWMLKDSRHGAKQTAYRIIIGTDSIAVSKGIGDFWDSQKLYSDNMLVKYNGRELVPFTKLFWRVQVWDKDSLPAISNISYFETGMLEEGDWKGAWINDGKSIDNLEAPYFRKEFNITKRVKDARVYIAVAGLYELSINGKKVGNHRLDPMFTRFDRRNLYVTYDVTDQILQDKNVIGVLLGNGWFNHQTWTVWDFINAPWRNRPTFCLDLRITYEDGSIETVSTDDSWRTSNSPIIFNSIYAGEHYDARLEKPGWDSKNFDDSSWNQAEYGSAPSQNIVSQQLAPIRNVKKIEPVGVNKINDSTCVFDLGINISGVSKFKIKGEKGTKFTLKHGELLNPDGTVDISNLNEYQKTDPEYPFQADIYILGGKGEESFIPHFNYKGFQYVEVTSDKPFSVTTENLTGYFMHSDVTPAGKIKTSNTTINKIWWATNNSYLSNLNGYPTDCPQREKCGWTGDAHIVVETGLYNFDGITLYEKWLADHRDEQQANGVLPAIIPTGGWGYGGGNGVDWTSSIAIIPWNIYLFYGDDKLLKDCYDNIKRYVNHITSISPSGLIDWGVGDHAPVKSKTPVELTSSVYYFLNATILSKTAKLLGKDDDYKYYSSLAEKIKDAINNKYLDKERGNYSEGNQTELSVPLYWGIVPEDLKSKVASNLAKRVVADDNHVDVGLLGSKTILSALSDNGYADLAYTLASQESFPSWGYWIVNNASTLYEHWPLENHNSKNHVMFGEISAWFFKSLGGIKPDPDFPGFKNILLQPSFVKGLMYFESSFVSPYGEIISNWERINNSIIYHVTIPANSTADFFIPKGYSLLNATLLSEDNVNTPLQILINESNTYKLLAGRYKIKLTSDVP